MKKYNPKYHPFRNGPLIRFGLKTLGTIILKNYDLKYDKIEASDEPFILLANHNFALDTAFEMIAYNGYIRSVAADHVVKTGLIGRLLNILGTPIVKHRNLPREVLMSDIKKTIENGVSVAMHPEGGTSLNGETRYFSSNTAKLVKECGCKLITYRFENGYLCTPRWAKSYRKATVYGKLIHEYSSEEIKKMSVEELHKHICDDLYVNLYDYQKEHKIECVGENLAEHVERVLYMCPECKSIGTLHSSKDTLCCDNCDLNLTMKPDGFFYSDKPVIYDNIRDWEHWQRKEIENYIDSKSGRKDFLFENKNQRLYKVTPKKNELINDNAIISMYKDRIELKYDEKTVLIPMKKIVNMQYIKRQALLIITETKYYEINASIPQSPLKYIDAWRYLTHRNNF